MRRLLVWSAEETAWGIRAGSVPLGNLSAGEFVLFISHISTGLGLSISSFFLLLLEDFGLQLQHLTRTPSKQAAHRAQLLLGLETAGMSKGCHFSVEVGRNLCGGARGKEARRLRGAKVEGRRRMRESNRGMRFTPL